MKMENELLNVSYYLKSITQEEFKSIETKNLQEMHTQFENLNDWVEDLIQNAQCEFKNGRDS